MPTSPRRLKVLIADDSSLARSGVMAVLRSVEFIEEVLEAANGREAVCKVEESQPDVVVMDARMPVMDGIQATRIIKNRWPELWVVVLTMCSNLRQDALAAGANAFMVKGNQVEELLASIAQAGKLVSEGGGSKLQEDEGG